jgi:hypothetical protein
MRPRNWWRFSSAAAVLTVALGAAIACAAQESSQDQVPQPSQDKPVVSADKIGAAEDQAAKVADGKRHGLPLETYGVVPGTKFLVSLEDNLGTKGTAERTKFKVKTLEPLEAGSGIYLPSGAEIEGHVSHVESAGATGRARIWLTFDEINTKFGRLPIVAEVISVPGEHSVKNKPGQEGLIEGRSSTQEDAAQAAAAGAALGAGRDHGVSGGVWTRTRVGAAQGCEAGIGVGTSALSGERVKPGDCARSMLEDSVIETKG